MDPQKSPNRNLGGRMSLHASSKDSWDLTGQIRLTARDAHHPANVWPGRSAAGQDQTLPDEAVGALDGQAGVEQFVHGGGPGTAVALDPADHDVVAEDLG